MRPIGQLLALGREDYEGGDPGVFNMAVMGLRLGARANGVSLLHGQVSRSMFAGLWPGFDVTEVPITSVTNGVHGPTWMAPELLELVGDDILSRPGQRADAAVGEAGRRRRTSRSGRSAGGCARTWS